jgi:hypothetical protein
VARLEQHWPPRSDVFMGNRPIIWANGDCWAKPLQRYSHIRNHAKVAAPCCHVAARASFATLMPGSQSVNTEGE